MVVVVAVVVSAVVVVWVMVVAVSVIVVEIVAVVVLKALVWAGAVINMSLKVLAIDVWADLVVVNEGDVEVIDDEFAVSVSCSGVKVDMVAVADAMAAFAFAAILEQLKQFSCWAAFGCWPLILLDCAHVLQAWMPSYHV